MRNSTAGLKACGYVLVMLAAVAPPAWAQQPAAPVVRLTLDEARTRAVEASHRLAEARARESVAQAAIAVRQAAERPIVSASAGYARTNHVTPFFVPGPAGLPRAIYPDVPDNYRSRLDLQWPIYTGGRTDALERAARSEADAAAASDRAARSSASVRPPV